jgi:hypothetical protein
MKKRVLPMLQTGALIILLCLNGCQFPAGKPETPVSSDTTPPAVVITNPADDAALDDDVLIQAEVSDDVGILDVSFYDGAALLYTDTGAPYEYEWMIFGKDNGVHRIRVVARDTSGNTSEDAVDVTVDIISADMPVPSVFINIFPLNSVISFTSGTPGAALCIGTSSNVNAPLPDSWRAGSDIMLSSAGTLKVFARAEKEGMKASPVFMEAITVAVDFPKAAGQPGSDAVHMDDAAIIAWATGYVNYHPGTDCDEGWQTPEKALGKAAGDSFDIVCLGNGGDITLTFSSPVTDRAGADFAVFENSVSDTFLEIAYVEVSSNGRDFVRFDCVSLTESPVPAFGTINPEHINGVGGRYRQGFGNPFDLSYLRYKEEVLDGTVDVSCITHVRIVDIRGNPDSGVTDYDSFGNIIYDPYRCYGSGGFDLEAVAVLHRSG